MKKRRNEDDKPFQGKKSGGRKSSSKKTEWTSLSKGKKRAFDNKDDNNKSSDKRNDDRKPFGKRREDDKSSDKRNDDRKPYGKRKEEGKFSDKRNDNRKPFGKRREEGKFSDKRNDDRKPFGKRREDDKSTDKRNEERKPFNKRKEDDRSSNKRNEDWKPFGKRRNDNKSSDKRSDDRKPFGKRREDDKSFNKRNDDRKSFGKVKEEVKSSYKRNDDRKSHEKLGTGRTFDSRTKDKRASDYGKSDKREFEEKIDLKPIIKPNEAESENPVPYVEDPDHKDTIRLNKYVANAGVASRRKADELIKQGFVKVNGEVVREMGHRVKPTDEIRFKDEVVKIEAKKVYFLLNKPKNMITTTDDEKGRKTVMDIMDKLCEERIYPVGRLDRHTTGLLLFTNDGDLAKRLSHPSYEVKKIYHVILDKPLEDADFDKITAGLDLEDGHAVIDKLEYDEGDRTKQSVMITIHIGRNRIVRRIFAHLDYTVEKLDRIYYAGLTKKNLSRGFARPLVEQEVIMLKHFI
jgi:23S rRNA pseudouridine2605 synthase